MLVFREMTKADIPLYLEWLNTSHVQEWWNSEDEKIHEKLDNPEYKHLFIVTWHDEPFAFIQVYDANFGGPSEHSTGVLGLDMFIGKESYLNKGFGTRMVSKLGSSLLARPEVPYLIIDPQVKNKRAIRCYEKAGFKRIKTITTCEGECLLMKFQT